MDLILLVLGLTVVGVIVELINKRAPIDPIIRVVIYIVVLIAMVAYLVKRFSGSIPNVLS